MSPLETFIAQYGMWAGLVIYILLKDVIPFLTGKYIPNRIRFSEKQRLERVEELASEREWQHKLENDRLDVLKEISDATKGLAISMAQTNANIANILSGQDRMLNKQDVHHNLMMDAVSDMRVTVAKKTPQKKTIQMRRKL